MNKERNKVPQVKMSHRSLCNKFKRINEQLLFTKDIIFLINVCSYSVSFNLQLPSNLTTCFRQDTQY